MKMVRVALLGAFVAGGLLVAGCGSQSYSWCDHKMTKVRQMANMYGEKQNSAMVKRLNALDAEVCAKCLGK
ncbi:MAG: hypothetical protein ACYTGH_09200 [Planctomycetota bacterium]|jgi:outer membrane murein-binding lipoprotein Lpp